MIRMEIACFLVLAFMAVIYFSARREKTRLHKVFSLFLIMDMLHLIFDGVTVYTVNHLDTVPLWINDILHRFFMGTMMILFYLAYLYIVLLVEDDTGKKIPSSTLGKIVLVIAMVLTVFLPITYRVTEDGNHLYGMLAYLLYIVLAVFLILIGSLLCRYWKQIHPKKRNAITLALVIQFIGLVVQAIFPLTLISGMGLMLVALSFYLTMENPDIALVQQVQKEKQKADEANAAKSIFLSNMSHEIRTPINAIMGMTDILLREKLSDAQRVYLTNIKSSGNALVSLINDILDLSKIEAGKMELVENVYEIQPMLSDIKMIIKNRIGKKQLQLLYDIDDLPDRLYGDGLRIRQVIINLLNNAVKFTEKGGIKLAIKIVSKTEDEIKLSFSVVDTGQGIRQEDLEKLFGAFEQVDAKKNKGKEGTGLGLAISSQFISMMGGKLEVKSTYGVGSEFYFTIVQKLVSEEMEALAIADDNTDFIAPHASILIVDDNEMNQKVAVGLLEPLQMEIDLADNGEQAIAMIQENDYDLVFMDHMMPIMDGIEATRRIREMDDPYYKELPIIALTANAMKESQKLFEEAGMNGFVAKPIEMKQICREIRKWVPITRIVDPEKEEEQSVEEKDQEFLGFKIEGLNTSVGIKYTGNRGFYLNVLSNFYQVIDSKALKIEKLLEDGLVKDYTIEVHALKSSARTIGAEQLGEEFWQLEQLGRAEDIEAIKEKTPQVLAHYRSYKDILRPYVTHQVGLKEVSKEEILLYLKGIQEAVEGFDMDAADEAMEKLEECLLQDDCQSLREKLRVYMADVAMEEILSVTQKMIEIVEQPEEEKGNV